MPSLETTRDFVHRFHATCCDRASDLAAVCSSVENNGSLQASLLCSVDQQTAAVAALSTNQEQLKSTMEEQHKTVLTQDSGNGNLLQAKLNNNVVSIATKLAILCENVHGVFIALFSVVGAMIKPSVPTTFMEVQDLTRTF